MERFEDAWISKKLSISAAKYFGPETPDGIRVGTASYFQHGKTISSVHFVSRMEVNDIPCCVFR